MLRSFKNVELTVVKNDKLADISISDYDKLIISPGPNLPNASGELMDFIGKHIAQIPTLGICLGHQAIAEYFGGELLQYSNPKHGERCSLQIIDDQGLFANLPKHFKVGLYHSWYVGHDGFPNELRITAQNEDGIIMATEHKTLPIYSVQFHPESYMSEYGHEILQNFICCS